MNPRDAVYRARRHALGDLLHRAARRDPDRPAIAYGAVRQSYAELDDTVNRVANALLARGLEKGDRAAVFSHNSYGFVVAALALAKSGLIMVPINFMLGPEEVAFILEHAGAKAMIAEQALAPVATKALEQLPAANQVTVLAVISDGAGDAVPHWQRFEDWYAYPEAAQPDVRMDDDDPVAITYTSGTESRPKGATLTSRSLIAQFVSCIVDGDMTRDDIELHPMPLYHCAQLYCFLMPDLYIGASSVVVPRPEPGAILRAVEVERVTKLFCPPTVWIGLLHHPDFGRRDLSSLRKGYYGASAMPVEVLLELSRRLPDVRFYNFYGQTEMSPMATLLRPEDQLRKPGSAGRPSMNVETTVVDPDGLPLPPGMVGEIVHRSPHAMLGYWREPDKTAETFRDGWFHSGDLGVIDEDGYLSVVDRKKDMIKTGGENVASREVEEAIYAHDGVLEVAIFGIPDPRWIEAVTAAVVPRTGAELTPDALIMHCRARLAAFKVPKHVVFVAELPKNASGKILKRELRSRFAGLASDSTAVVQP